MEVTKLKDIKFKTMVIKMCKELTDNYKKLSDNYISMKKEIETINKNQEEMNNFYFSQKFLFYFSEIKNPLEGIISR